jgi:hypothetical protein
MNYGPLEFAAYIKRKGAGAGESATVKAAREAAPTPASGDLLEINRLTVISGGPLRPRDADAAPVESSDDSLEL